MFSEIIGKTISGVATEDFGKGDLVYLSEETGKLTRAMPTPNIYQRVLAFVEDEEYPFVGYWNGEEWMMETEYLNCDTHRSDILGKVIHWVELPSL